MKKVTKTFEVYDYSELSEKAKQFALNDWNEHNDLSILQDILQSNCLESLKEHGITCTSNYPTVLYSLSHSQGDGVMFEGQLTWERYSVSISHSGHYYHSNSKTVDIIEDTDEGFQASNEAYEKFESIYQSICKKLEKYGYDWIEEEQSEAHFIDECNGNEWVFESDGELFHIPVECSHQFNVKGERNRDKRCVKCGTTVKDTETGA